MESITVHDEPGNEILFRVDVHDLQFAKFLCTLSVTFIADVEISSISGQLDPHSVVTSLIDYIF